MGVTPDIVVYPGAAPENENSFSIKESDLKRHLQGELDKANVDKINQQANKPEAQKDDKKFITQSMIYQDIQLKSAIDVLKAWGVIGTFGINKSAK